jgi:hypothetical protein
LTGLVISTTTFPAKLSLRCARTSPTAEYGTASTTSSPVTGVAVTEQFDGVATPGDDSGNGLAHRARSDDADMRHANLRTFACRLATPG